MNRSTYKQPRPRIPNDLQRKVKMEAGHKCAVNKCNSITCEILHIDGNRENNVIENLIFLCRNHHKQAHDGFITTKELMEYKQTASFLDRNAFALEFYKKHVLKLDEALNLKYWIDISHNLSIWRLHNNVKDSFINGVNIIRNTRYPEEYPDLGNAIENISDILSDLISLFTDDENVVFIEGCINCWMYRRWKAETWYPPMEYDTRYKQMEVWQNEINNIHFKLIAELNNFAEEIWRHILPNYRDRQRFNTPNY